MKSTNDYVMQMITELRNTSSTIDKQNIARQVKKKTTDISYMLEMY